MFDDKTSAAASAATFPLAAQTSGKSSPSVDQEPAWKSEFRQTLNEIMKVGFGTYTRQIQEEKMEEMRAKILQSMGLTEEDLENMPPEQRQQIEKMVAQEIQERLAAEKALEANGGDQASANIDAQVRAAPNGLGSAIVLLQALDQGMDQPAGDPSDEPQGR